MYSNESTSNSYPKTLVIRNHQGGMIWQIYHVEAEHEAGRLSANATKNGFFCITLEDYRPDMTETWPNWRDNASSITEL